MRKQRNGTYQHSAGVGEVLQHLDIRGAILERKAVVRCAVNNYIELVTAKRLSFFWLKDID
jgi:hypothetical protein